MEPLFDMATARAKESPCVRRQYGALIYSWYKGTDREKFVSANNSRITTACTNGCVREQMGIPNGTHTKTEIGGEIHAEAAVLLKSQVKESDGWNNFILVGFSREHEFLGEDVYPCLWCAKMIKFAGYHNIFIRNKQRDIVPISIEEIIEYWETPYELA